MRTHLGLLLLYGIVVFRVGSACCVLGPAWVLVAYREQQSFPGHFPRLVVSVLPWPRLGFGCPQQEYERDGQPLGDSHYCMCSAYGKTST